MEKIEKQRINLKINKNFYQELKKIAIDDDVLLSKALEVAVEEYIQRRKDAGN